MKYGVYLLPIVVGLFGCASFEARNQRQALAKSLTFHAPFDNSLDASFAKGDPRFHTGPQWGRPRQPSTTPPPADVHLAPGQGRFGGAIRFERKIKQWTGFPADKNIAYNRSNWSGTFSYWLRLHPEQDLEPGYCDPVQITSKDWNDASFFTDFSKDEVPRHFRLGVFSDLKFWNPSNAEFDKLPESERPMITVKKPLFGREHWTHIAFTWQNFNSGRPDASAHFYIDGVLQGSLTGKPQSYDWISDTPVIMLGLSLTGWIDDIAAFDRALSPEEIRLLKSLPNGAADLHR